VRKQRSHQGSASADPLTTHVSSSLSTVRSCQHGNEFLYHACSQTPRHERSARACTCIVGLPAALSNTRSSQPCSTERTHSSASTGTWGRNGGAHDKSAEFQLMGKDNGATSAAAAQRAHLASEAGVRQKRFCGNAIGGSEPASRESPEERVVILGNQARIPSSHLVVAQQPVQQIVETDLRHRG
jgi:hypothetical protein